MAQAAGGSQQPESEWRDHRWPFQVERFERRAQALRAVQQRLEEAALMALCSAGATTTTGERSPP